MAGMAFVPSFLQLRLNYFYKLPRSLTWLEFSAIFNMKYESSFMKMVVALSSTFVFGACVHTLLPFFSRFHTHQLRQATVHTSTNEGQSKSTRGAFTNGSAMDRAIDLDP